MITDAFIAIAVSFVSFLLAPILSQPNVVLDPNLAGAFANVQGFYSSMNPLFPIDTLLSCLMIILSIEIAIFAYKAIMWVIKKIPMIS